MYMDLPEAGEYTITVSEIQNLPLGACIYLEDTQSQQIWTVSVGAEWVLIMNEAYTGSDRFVMHVGAFAQVNTTDPTCANLPGSIEVAAEEGSWVMTVVNANGETLASEISGIYDAAFGGDYTVEIRNTEAACSATPITVIIEAPADASFAYVFENAACNEGTGQIIYEMVNGGEYQMQLLNSEGLIISEMTTTESYLELLDLAPDSYTLTLTNACTSFTENISLLDENAVSAEIDAANTNVVFTEGTSGMISLTATIEGATEINWYVNGEMITTGTALNYEITEAGEYVVTVTAANESCDAEDQVVIQASTVVSTDEIENEGVTIVNRANHAIISFNGISATASTIAIYNSLGQLVYSKVIGESTGQVVDVDMQNWAAGAYTVRVTDEQVELMSKTLMK
jgi:Secretion system C-terminal sorting domain